MKDVCPGTLIDSVKDGGYSDVKENKLFHVANIKRILEFPDFMIYFVSSFSRCEALNYKEEGRD
jgi:hypothetical protein